MAAIWKYIIQPSDRIVIQMPKGAKILTVQMQGSVPCLWAEVDPSQCPVNRVIEIRGTGHNIPSGRRRYIGTFQMYSGELVFHAFEQTEESDD